MDSTLDSCSIFLNGTMQDFGDPEQHSKNCPHDMLIYLAHSVGTAKPTKLRVVPLESQDARLQQCSLQLSCGYATSHNIGISSQKYQTCGQFFESL